MEPSEQTTLALLAADVDEYYEQLVASYWRQLKVFVQIRLGHLQDAEDIVQEAFVRAYVALDHYSLEQRRTLKARAWLYRITWNVLCNHMGRSKQSLLVSLEAAAANEIQEREDDEEVQPEIAFELLERRHELEALVETLPLHYRIVVALYYFEELSYQEIATMLSQPLGTVKVYVHRGVRLLRKALQQTAGQGRIV